MIKVHYMLFLVLFPLTLILPQQGTLHPDTVNYPVYMDHSPALKNMKMIPPGQENKTFESKIIPNHIRPNPNKTIIKNENFRDPVAQNQFGTLQTSATITNFDGMSNACGCYPPDPNGDVGLNHIIQSVNSQFQIWNKTGASLYGPANLSTLWADVPGPWVGTNDGDPIVLYDQLADRWLISQFSLPTYPKGPFYELIAISSTADPLGTWNRYIYSFSNMPDYPKIGVWSDGYYLSVNYFAASSLKWAGTGVCVMERNSMLAGDTARIVQFSTTTRDIGWSWLPSDADGKILPPAGTPNYFMMEVDGVDWDGGADRLRSRALHVDWNNTANSTFGAPVDIGVAAFDENMCSFNASCIPQSGTSIGLDAISDRLMHRLQYRNFGSYQAIVANHTVDVGSDHAGMRWYELRNTGSGWTVYQQGTYAPDATHRWMGSVAMDGDGDIASGYSNSSSTMYPAIKYTGRYKSDPLGTFSLAEQTIMSGTGSQTGTASRWGDYSMMTVDPSDDATFWYTNEYLQTTGTNPWKTRIASFKISSLALSSPVGGEFWTNNSVHNVTWAATGVSNVKLEYTTDNGTTWNNIVASTSGTTGSYAWTLPALSYDLVKVRITDLANSSLIGQSTNYFSVANNTSTLSPATGSSSSTNFTGTGITFTGNVTVSAPVTVNYYSTHIAAGTLPSGVQIVSPYFWVVTNTGSIFTNGKMIVPLSFLSGIGNSSSLRWLKRTNKADAWTNIGGTVNGSNLESNVAFSSFSEFAIGSVDSTNFVPTLTLNLTAFIQGITNIGGTAMTNAVNPISVTVELHNSTTPYALVESKTGVLNTAGVGIFNFTTAVNATPYYIVFKSANTIETWSAAAQSFTSGALSYDFTTAAAQAYESNMIYIGSKWCIYSGDVNQDGSIDSQDITAIDNDYTNYAYGPGLVTDINGDGSVDSQDITMCDNNYTNYVYAAKPTSLPTVESIIHEVKFEKRRIK
jgi:Dockerin type I domain